MILISESLSLPMAHTSNINKNMSHIEKRVKNQEFEKDKAAIKQELVKAFLIKKEINNFINKNMQDTKISKTAEFAQYVALFVFAIFGFSMLAMYKDKMVEQNVSFFVFLTMSFAAAIFTVLFFMIHGPIKFLSSWNARISWDTRKKNTDKQEDISSKKDDIHSSSNN